MELQSRCIPYVIVQQTRQEVYKSEEWLPGRLVKYVLTDVIKTERGIDAG